MVEQVSVMEADWDYLVILDACRYDYFSELYRDYLRGELEKVVSLGSSTLEWCQKSFQEVYNDVIYISANPYINSKGEVKGFKATDHFHKVIDVWDWGWDAELGTVHPKKVNEVAQRVKDNYPSKRLIVHYLQPHAPYLGYQPHAFGFPRFEIGRGQPLVGMQSWRNHSFFEVSLVKLLAVLIKPVSRKHGLFGRSLLWKICELLNLPPVSPMDATRRKFGDTGLRRAYVQNLKIVLEHVTKLVECLSGVIVITADHGECLGERRRYSHLEACRDQLLLEVPWLVVKGGVARKRLPSEEKSHAYTYINPEKQQAEKIKKRLRELGYL